ncbi:MAG: Cytochrome C553 (Soluble cytochrome f) [uncultured Sulfurovum sp.]|uniref:Cytochrome C553 (Soluble cytochrome f) n=1 Tax=uncultured Sulfurovum sp. TaxID=269237 RepID=A0A6S6T4N7_9BACT|nr:MAG: Cytochrome C553 (Soluble cytochrome f) [uncultured Sulfurovum sp.]
MKKVILFTFTTLALFADSQELYKNCAGCHGENGETSALGQSAVITGQDINLSIKQLTAYKNGELNKYGLGNIMQLQLTALNSKNIKELAEYISNMDVNGSPSK